MRPEEPAHAVTLHRAALRGVAAMTLVSARGFPRHSHDQYGVGLLTHGAQRSWSGVGQVEAGPGDVIAVNPGEMHDGAPMGPLGRRAWRMLYLDPPLVRRFAGEWGEGAPEIARPVLRDAALAAALASLFERLRLAPDALASEEALAGALALLLRRHGSRGGGGRAPRSCPAVGAARRRLDEAPELPVTLGELASLAGVGPFQLLRGFRREVGTTPHAYLLQRRVLLARRLLAEGTAPAEAAQRAGFADQSHLTRAFRRQLGVTPARYRAALA